MRESKAFMLDVVKFLFARSTEKGSRTYFHAVVDAGVESHGEYSNDCKIQTYVSLCPIACSGLVG
jgi:hypothetical protein